MLLSDWLDRQTDRHTNIFCLQDPFFQKRERCTTFLYAVSAVFYFLRLVPLNEIDNETREKFYN